MQITGSQKFPVQVRAIISSNQLVLENKLLFSKWKAIKKIEFSQISALKTFYSNRNNILANTDIKLPRSLSFISGGYEASMKYLGLEITDDKNSKTNILLSGWDPKSFAKVQTEIKNQYPNMETNEDYTKNIVSKL